MIGSLKRDVLWCVGRIYGRCCRRVSYLSMQDTFTMLLEVGMLSSGGGLGVARNSSAMVTGCMRCPRQSK